MYTASRITAVALGLLVATAAQANRERTFYEGFEGRASSSLSTNEKDFASNVWLPEGWNEFSKIAGHKNYPDIPGASDVHGPEEWDYTWCTKPSSELYGRTPYGSAYAHVMTHNWSVGQDQTPKESDEWLVTPTITVQDGDVLSFATCFNPYLTIRPDNEAKPTAKTNVLEVRISVDGGNNWSDALWDSYQASLEMSVDELIESIVSYDWVHKFRMYFIDIDPYYGKDVKIAFRYYGKGGADISLDEVAVGIPTPEASYELPAGYLWPALTEKVDPAQQPLAYAPAGREQTWTNTSIYAKSYDWAYGGASTSTERDLVTPAYDAGTVMPFPTLNSRYGVNESGAWSLVNHPSAYTQQFGAGEPKIQYGGTIGKTVNSDGTECRGGVATYNLWDPDVIGVKHQPGIAISSMAEMLFDNRYTHGSVRDWDFLQSIGTIYPQPATPYGVDYFYANVIIENIEADTELHATIHPWETEIVAGQETSYAGDPIAVARISYDPATVGSGTLTTIMFDFTETPVTVETPYVILISGFRRGPVGDSGRPEILDNIRFPYVLTTSSKYSGTSLATFKEYDSSINAFYPAYAHLGTFTGAAPDSHIGGLLMGIGISHSTMELRSGDNLIEAAPAGGSKTFTVAASTDPSTWRLVEGALPCTWATFSAVKKGEDLYDVTITVARNEGEDRDNTIRLASSGSYVNFTVKQLSGADDIISEDTDAPAEYYNLQGVRIANPSGGIFIRRQGNLTEKVIIP